MKVEVLEKYKRVIADEGKYLTDYKEGDDILDFRYAKIMCTPLNTDISNLREISSDECFALEEERIKEEEKYTKTSF